MAVSLGRKDGRGTRSSAATRASTRCATRDAADAVPGVRADHDRLRQVLHLLHRAERPRPEQSRPPEQIVAEARVWPIQGCKEITLLGQTVNSYRYASGGRTTRLSDLLARCTRSTGLERIKFVTNYPKDMTDDLLEAVRDLPKVSPYLHVPAQSGSTTCWRMKRGYTVGRLPRDDGPHSARRCPGWRSRATSSSASAARRRRDFQKTWTWCASAASRTASSSSTASGPARRRGAVRRRRARGSEEAPQQRAANPRLIGQIIPVGIEDASSFTLYGMVETSEQIGAEKEGYGESEISSSVQELQERGRITLPLV
jgi:hypothetical protein